MSIRWERFPLSMTELGIYLDWTKNLKGTAYNLPFLLPLPPGTDQERLKKALESTFLAHPNLLSRIRVEEGGEICRLIPGQGKEPCPVRIEEISAPADPQMLVKPFSDPEGELYRLSLVHGEQEEALFLDLHHLLFDGASLPIFFAELNRAFSGGPLQGEGPGAPQLARSEKKERAGEGFFLAKEHFRRLLEDCPGRCRPFPDRGEGPARCAVFTLPLALDKKAAAETAKRLGIRVSTLFAGAYGYLLGRFAGAREAAYATVHSGRTKENADAIGMFVKTVPVVWRFSPEEEIGEHLKALDEQITISRKMGLFSYADCSAAFGFSAPTLFAYQGDLEKEVDFLGTPLVPRPMESADPKEELVAEVFRGEEGYTLRLTFRQDLYSSESMEQLALSYEKILQEFPTRQRFAEVDLLSKKQEALLNRFLPAARTEEPTQDILTLFRQQAGKRPEAMAVILEEERLTYGLVDERSDRIACELRKRGIGRGDVVSILIGRNTFMVVAPLGVLKAGAAYQPLDPSYPPERLLFMTKDAGAKLVVADRELAFLLEGYAGELLYTDEVQGLSPFSGDPLPAPGPHDLFTLLYTSGSTGVPKGVMLEHGNLANFCRWYRREYGITEQTVHAAYASFGFDANLMDLYPALSAGACICIVPERLRLNLSALGKYLEENRVDMAFMTTQVGRQFAVSPFRPSCLKSLSVGGERLSPISPPAGLKLYNLYGPTECTILATKQAVDREYPRIPIGYPVADAALYVVDEQGRRVPPGVPGELWIAGPGVARGYLNRPEKDAESFTPNPFCRVPGWERVYHTGDIVRFLPEGSLDFVGREDGQVKIRGFRIELSEIEAVLREHPGIKDCTVQAFSQEQGGGMVIAAYVVRKEGQSLDPAELKEYIRKRKPPYMVPAFLRELPEIPLNQNQKVDKKRLPRPEEGEKTEGPGKERALTELERELFALCRDALGERRFDVDVPLTEEGLNSISAMGLMAKLEERYGFSPEVSALLGGMCLLDLENALVAHWRGKNRKTDEEKGAASAEGMPLSAPLTKSQLGIYLECLKDRESDRYHIPLLFKLDGETDGQRLLEAIWQAIEAHPAMKSSVEAQSGGGAAAIAHPELAVPLSPEESDRTEEELEAELFRERVAFDPEKPPLFRIRLIRTAKAYYLSMVFHHLLMDGTGIAVFLEDVEQAYQGKVPERERTSFLDLALEEEKRRSTQAYDRAKEFHAGILSGAQGVSLPPGERGGDPRALGKAGCYELCLKEPSLRETEDFCVRLQITENTLFTAAFALLLAYVTGSDEALFAFIHNGRTRAEALRCTGMLVKTCPLLVPVSGEASTEDFLRMVQERIRLFRANDLYSFAEAARDFGVSAEVLFAWQGDRFSDYVIGGKRAVELKRPLEDAKAALSLDVWKRKEGYLLSFEYREDLYPEAELRWMGELMGMLVKGLVREKNLGELPLLSPAAKAFLEEINATEHPLSFRPVSALLEENAGRFPERMAVVTSGGRLTYGELNAAANRIANGLIPREVRGRIVALMLSRSEKVYAVRQGILKAGAAFLSLDPAYPDERIRMMAEDSEMALVIVPEKLLRVRQALWETLPCPAVSLEELLKTPDTENPGVIVRKEDPAYCIFTSGSTGKPKGVLLTQGNLFNFLDDNPKNPEILGYTERGRVSLAIAAITFDVSIMEEFIPLAHGMTVCMADEEEIHNPAALAALMRREGVDVMTCTPSFLSNLIGLEEMKEPLTRIRTYDLGAEAMPAALYDRIRRVSPEALIMNGYGPTEATISCTMDAVRNGELITIGRPAANVRAYLLDAEGRILPPLACGELVIAGEGVGMGYLANPGLTAERFITLEGLRAYRTGDLAAWTSDGRLRFKGRKDNQVKLRGLRVELDEIEQAILSVPGVKACAVVMAGEGEKAFLAGYYTASRPLEPETVRGEIGKTLTAYMVPGALMQLERMPLTPNGKIDRRRLPKVEAVPEEAEYEPPANAAEEDFCGWFASLLGLERVSAAGNFFALGGTSLTAAVIAMNAEKKGYGIVYADLFKAQTPRELAALALEREASPGKPAAETAGKAQGSVKARAEGERARMEDARLPLGHNRVEELPGLSSHPLGNLLLTGATGFLGIHVLREYLLQEEGRVYCLLRGKEPEKRLKELYFYYFDESPERFFAEGRVRILPGDITEPASLEALKTLDFQTLINCAALVKHFVRDDSLERVNVRGVENLITLCAETGKRLIQTSTVSVAGEGLDGNPPRSWLLTEDQLDHGQLLDNAYALSKFRAEQAVLTAAGRGLDARIMRLGNLMGRRADGEFQLNFRSNAFIRTLAGYRRLGVAPYSLMSAATDLSEIDMTARAILLLSGTDKRFTVFHPVNPHALSYGDILHAMGEYGFAIRGVEDQEFRLRLKEGGEASGALIAYESHEGAARRYMLGAEYGFTTEALFRLGFQWPVTGEEYVVKMLKALDELTMFED